MADIQGPPVLPVGILPVGIAECEGFPRSEWYCKAVVLTTVDGVHVGRGLCQSIDCKFVTQTGGVPLGDDHVAVLVAESLDIQTVPLDWMYGLKQWPIRHVLLNGVSLYDHEQRSLYNSELQTFRRGPRVGLRQYNSTTRHRTDTITSKKEVLLTTESINSVSSVVCCSRNCLQPFPRSAIFDLRSELHRNASTYFQRYILLDVHRQMHEGKSGNKVVTLHGIDVCPEAWCVIMGVSRSTFYCHQSNARIGAHAEHHGNTGTKKPRAHTLQAIATVGDMINNIADHMPHRTTTLGSGDKVPSRSLPSSFNWRGSLPEVNNVNALFGLRPVSVSGLSRICGREFREYSNKKRGDNFARCGKCDQLKQLKAASTRGSGAFNMWEIKLRQHQASQQAHRVLYYGNRKNSEENPDQVVCIIHDKMDYSKTASLHFSHKNKSIDALMKLPVSVTGMIAHGHGDVRYAYFGLDIFPFDSNHTVGSIAKLLRDLERPPLYSSRALFIGSRSAPLFEAVLAGANELCIPSLPSAPLEPVLTKPLPPILQMQLDNAAGDNKNRYVLAFFFLLVSKGIFREVYVNFLLVGHTHEDIDALFGRWSAALKSNNYPTVPLLMKSFMDVEAKPVIPHLVEEVPNFKDLIEGFLGDGDEALEGHTNAQQFKFYKDTCGRPMMQYKLLYTDRDWLPMEDDGIQLWKVSSIGRPSLPTGDPCAVSPQSLRNFDEVTKGISGFISLGECMANEDLLGDFRRKNEHVLHYWRVVKAALNSPVSNSPSLQEGFWPHSRYVKAVVDEYEFDGTLREEYGVDAPFVEQRRHRPPPSFRVGRDVREGFVLAICPADGDARPFWLALALTNPHSDEEHPHEIQLQYLMPASQRHVDPDTYSGWDSARGNFWVHDPICDPMWSDIDCIMTAWKRKSVAGREAPSAKLKIPRAQVDIIKASVNEY